MIDIFLAALLGEFVTKLGHAYEETAEVTVSRGSYVSSFLMRAAGLAVLLDNCLSLNTVCVHSVF